MGEEAATLRLGLLGGTFDPPHIGHLILAEVALDALRLARVLFVPAADPPHKVGQPITPVAHRLAMLEAAIAQNPRFALSRADLDRPGPHYTVDMLDIVQREHPDASLYLLMGGDSLSDLLTWRDPPGIARRARLAVMRRPGTPVDMTPLAQQIPDIVERCVVVSAPMIGISATTLREEVKAGRSIRYQVPDAVMQYIAAHRLYRD